MGAPPVDALDALAGIARELGDEGAATDAVALRQRVDEGRFFVACVGQFKRGKSTVINALVGDEVLPVGVIPVTAVVTVVRHGEVRRVRVKTRQAGWHDVAPSDLSAYVAEEHNPDNIKEVLGVEAFVPSPLLACGMCLVDTPGLGSVHASNTAATREFLPHIDAALVVLGADPPISGDELALVQEVAREVTHVVFVINKADRLAETDVAQARVFTSKVVADRLQRAAPEILIVSAKERTRDGPTRDWATLERSLGTLAQEGGGELVEAARRRGLARITARLEHDIAVHRTALERPLEESELRLAAMTHAVEDAQRALRQLEYLFRAEEDAIRRMLEERRNVFLRESLPAVAADLLARLNAGDPATAPRTAAFAMAQAIAHERLEKWTRSIQPEAEDCYRRATSTFVTLGNDFLRRLVATGDDAFAGLPREIEPEVGFRTASHFYFTEILTLAEPPSMTGVLDALRNRQQAVRAAHGRALPYLERLLDTNSSRMINDLVSRVRESGAKLRSELVTTLRAVTTTAGSAIERARVSRSAGGAGVQQELAHLEELAVQVRATRP
jgi:GTP-binding protein EngB required for normal cell division